MSSRDCPTAHSDQDRVKVTEAQATGTVLRRCTRYKHLLSNRYQTSAEGKSAYLRHALRALQFLGRPLPRRQAARQGDLGEGLLRLSVAQSQFLCIREGMRETPHIHSLLCSLIKLSWKSHPLFMCQTRDRVHILDVHCIALLLCGCPAQFFALMPPPCSVLCPQQPLGAVALH